MTTDWWKTFLIAWDLRDQDMMQHAMEKMAAKAIGGPDNDRV